MRNRVFFCLLALTLMFLASPQVHADDDALPFYLSAKVASSFMHVDDWELIGVTGNTDDLDDSDTVAGFGAAIGYNFDDHGAPIRTEIEYMNRSDFDYSYSDNNMSADADINAQTFFLNAYLDWHNDTKFIPYVGAGLGLAVIKTSMSAIDKWADPHTGRSTESNFAWNIGAGTAYSFTDNFLIDLGYRYVDFGKARGTEDAYACNNFETVTYSSNITSHEIILGFRFQF